MTCVYQKQGSNEKRTDPHDQCLELKKGERNGLLFIRPILIGSVMSIFGHGNKRDMPILISAKPHTRKLCSITLTEAHGDTKG